MVMDTIFGVLFAAGEGFLAILPDWTAPAFLSTITGYATDLGEYASSMAQWVPFDVAVTVITAMGALFAVVAAGRLGLWLWSKIPVVGGA